MSGILKRYRRLGGSAACGFALVAGLSGCAYAPVNPLGDPEPALGVYRFDTGLELFEPCDGSGRVYWAFGPASLLTGLREAHTREAAGPGEPLRVRYTGELISASELGLPPDASVAGLAGLDSAHPVGPGTCPTRGAG